MKPSCSPPWFFGLRWWHGPRGSLFGHFATASVQGDHGGLADPMIATFLIGCLPTFQNIGGAPPPAVVRAGAGLALGRVVRRRARRDEITPGQTSLVGKLPSSATVGSLSPRRFPRDQWLLPHPEALQRWKLSRVGLGGARSVLGGQVSRPGFEYASSSPTRSQGGGEGRIHRSRLGAVLRHHCGTESGRLMLATIDVHLRRTSLAYGTRRGLKPRRPPPDGSRASAEPS